MKILGIETSCDETAAAVVENGSKVLSNVIASQISLHQKTGGVVPEIAAREHTVKMIPVIDEALKQAGVSLSDLDAIAVTQGPGLLSSLIIGFVAASTLALVLKKPLIPVHHVAGHIYANWLEEKPFLLGNNKEISINPSDHKPQFPLLVLTVSGGHNELILLKNHFEFELIGETLDDAAGEAFDKVARLLGLGYPGGPAISKIAELGNAQAIKFPKAMMGKENFNFSFSGLKTSVLNTIKSEHEKKGELSQNFIADCAASFQETVCETLSEKLLLAAKKYKVQEIHLAGGVSANLRLRKMVQEKLVNIFELKNIIFRYAENLSFCTDNAAMIAAAGYFSYQKNPHIYNKKNSLTPNPQLFLYSPQNS